MSSSRPPGLWALLQVFYRLDGKEMSNDFWYRLSAAPTLPAWNGGSAATVIYGAVAAEMQNLTSSSVTFLGGWLYVNNGTGTIGFQHPDYVSVGLIGGNSLPEDVALVVQREASSFVRGTEGRWYFSGVPETFATGSYVNATGNAAISAFAIATIAPLTDQGITYTLSNFSPKLANMYAVTGITAARQLGTRRRRRVKF
jgi:hypothetical protein